MKSETSTQRLVVAAGKPETSTQCLVVAAVGCDLSAASTFLTEAFDTFAITGLRSGSFLFKKSFKTYPKTSAEFPSGKTCERISLARSKSAKASSESLIVLNPTGLPISRLSATSGKRRLKDLSAFRDVLPSVLKIKFYGPELDDRGNFNSCAEDRFSGEIAQLKASQALRRGTLR